MKWVTQEWEVHCIPQPDNYRNIKFFDVIMFNATVQCTLIITHGGEYYQSEDRLTWNTKCIPTIGNIWRNKTLLNERYTTTVHQHKRVTKPVSHNATIEISSCTIKEMRKPNLKYQILADMPDRSTESRQNSTSFCTAACDNRTRGICRLQAPNHLIKQTWSLPLSFPFLVSLLTPWIMLVQTAGRPTADARRRFDFQVSKAPGREKSPVTLCACASGQPTRIANFIMCGAVCVFVTDIYICKVHGSDCGLYLPSVCALSSQWVKCVKKWCNLVLFVIILMRKRWNISENAKHLCMHAS